MRYGMKLRRQEIEEMGWIVECFKCGKKGHKCRECSEQKKEKETREERAVYVAMPQEAQQKE